MWFCRKLFAKQGGWLDLPHCMRSFFLWILLSWAASAGAQQGFTFLRFSTEDGTGLNSNAVYSLHQDDKGFLWVGTANGLQRFDGVKFIQFKLTREGNDPFPYSPLTQIIPVDSGRMLLHFQGLREFGIFNPVDFSYHKVSIKTAQPMPARAEFSAWADSRGVVYLNVLRYGVLQYDKQQNAFVDNHPFAFPAEFQTGLIGVHEDVVTDRIWFAGKKGLCIFDRASGQMWHHGFNPKNLPLLRNDSVQENITQVYIDRKRRIWINNWPMNGKAGQHKYCFDSTGSRLLSKDTLGLLSGTKGYTEYNHFFEGRKAGLWIYGVGVLYNWDRLNQRFHFNRSATGQGINTIDYDKVTQVVEDRDGNLWIATNSGLYFTSMGSGTYSVMNAIIGDEAVNIEDILEMPNGDMWYATWGRGVIVTDSMLQPKPFPIQSPPPPADWQGPLRDATILTWNLYRRPSTGEVWVGCQAGVIMVYNLQKKSTRYLRPPEAAEGTIRFITEDRQGQLWLATQGGRLLRSNGKTFTVVQDVGNIIYKILVDNEGLLWLTTQDRGLYCVNPTTGVIVRHWTADGTEYGLYSNSGKDIEQLHDGTIVYGAGALNFISKKTGKVRLLRYENGLPSNNVERLRLDADGYLWMITLNGLSRYNPYKEHITTYGRRDGITLAMKTTYTDHLSSRGYVLFAGSNAVMMFRPALFANSQPPPAVVITDFRIGDMFVPTDSLLQLPKIKLEPEQNTFAIYFSSLSYQQRDRLTYYYKMEGIDKEWQTGDGVSAQNYSLLPAGNYVFKVYAVNVEGQRSPQTTEVRITIRPPVWQTKWFLSALLLGVVLTIYFMHRERVHRLLAVEKIRTRVARDLHDDMGSTLSTINILSSMAKSKMTTDPVKTAGYISKISDNSQRMMEAMDDIVWSIKPANDTMQRVTARMREFATGVLEAKDVALKFSVSEDVFDAKLNMEARRDFFLIFKEALNNSAKYSKATLVEVTVGLQNKQLSFEIRDNGTGFDVAAADSGNGLGNMQKRAEGMRGKLRIRSGAGEGTEVKLMVPVA